MLLVHVQAFDDIISGTSAAWYTPSSLSDQLGAADGFAIQACTTFVSGTGPTLTVQSEHSSDNRVWLPVSGFDIKDVTIANDGAYWSERNPFFSIRLGLVRFKITLGGAAPKCRLKLYFTGRVFGAPAVS